MSRISQTAATQPAATRTAIEHSHTEPPAILAELIEPSGIRFNGDRPWDIRVHDPTIYDRVLRDGSLGLGESYMEGGWDSDQLDETFHRLLSHDLDERIHGVARLRFLMLWLGHMITNRQSRARAFQVGEHHYDIGNDIYESMLDSSMSYSCGYWEHAADLEQAQQAKLAMTCRKLQLEPGQRLLDIGCGWGGMARYAAEHHGVEVVGITVSKEQQKLARERCKGLPVDIRLSDYRDLHGRFDRIVSIGMFEHVGPKNDQAYFGVAHQLLADDGLFLLHTIGTNRTTATTDAWIDKYIFPNGRVPSAQRIARAIEPFFVFEDWHNFGQDYDRTLMAWWRNFDAAWPELRAKYGGEFYRMWKYYLHCCAGFFRARQGQLWQIVLSKRARRTVYRSMR